jgi:hypothetical protein
MVVGNNGNCSTNNTASDPRKIESEVPQLCILLVSRILILESSFVSTSNYCTFLILKPAAPAGSLLLLEVTCNGSLE